MDNHPPRQNVTRVHSLTLKQPPLFFGAPIAAWMAMAIGFIAASATLNSAVHAGLSPSDVVVAVNGGSQNSRALANHYVALRGIPARNVIVLDQVPPSEQITVTEFRESILKPLLSEVERRKLSAHIRCIAYSADFPSAVDISLDVDFIENLPTVFTKKGSINSLTFLYSQVLPASPVYIGAKFEDLTSNFYARRSTEAYFSNPSGDATIAQWTEIQTLVASGEHDQASEKLKALHANQPHQFPLLYLAAAEAALGESPETAIELLNSAIKTGWTDGAYMKEDERFDAIRDHADFQLLELLTDSSSSGFQNLRGFEPSVSWAPNGVPTTDPKLGFRYLLSVVLGVTRGGGTSLEGAIRSLRRASRVDSSHPVGSFYFTSTSDVRTKTRRPGFDGAIQELREMGFGAEVVKTKLPENRDDILGAQIGTATFDFKSSKSTLIPGAIVDNLTSHGGIMSTVGGQTKLTRLIEAGAAGSSGTVVEPYALQPKFPHPNLYVHYAQGASLAEAFYLNVSSPYQLLIVGDPLCKPFSNAPAPQVDDSLRLMDDRGTLTFEFARTDLGYLDWKELDSIRATRSAPLGAAQISILFDGIKAGAGAMQSRLNVGLNHLSPGYHELTLSFTADDPLLQRSERTIPIWIGDEETIKFSPSALTATESRDPLPGFHGASEVFRCSLQDEHVIFEVVAEGAERVSVWHEWEQLSVASKSSSKFSIPLVQLGRGPVRLHARAVLPGNKAVMSLPCILEVMP